MGLNWDCKADKFYFDLQEVITLAKSLLPTRRSILKVSAKFFNPLGLLSPFIIGTKILFQSLCKDKVGWDEKLEGTLAKNETKSLRNWSLEVLSTIKVPRCYYVVDNVLVEQQVHRFCDALERAYAVYLRSVYANWDISVRLISSTTRVAPLKEQTIPRLELLGATILARLVLNCFISNIEIYCWADSYTVLRWIKNDKPWRQYVQHRVNEIRKLTFKNAWRFCPGTMNPSISILLRVGISRTRVMVEWANISEKLARSLAKLTYTIRVKGSKLRSCHETNHHNPFLSVIVRT